MEVPRSTGLSLGPVGGEAIGLKVGTYGEVCVTTENSVSIFEADAEEGVGLARQSLGYKDFFAASSIVHEMVQRSKWD